MILHENKEDFRDAIQATAEALGIRGVFIEKDYWVTFALKRLANSQYKSEVVFKGGTSLSKAYNVINRFSEDIDLAIIERQGVSGGQIKNKLKKVEELIVGAPFEEDKDFNSSKGSKFRKTGHRYPKTMDGGEFGHASDKLILEINAFSSSSAINKMPIETYIAQFLRKKNKELIEKYGLESFEMIVLDITRTFTEKLLSLVRISINDDDDYQGLREKIRHFYDLHKMMDHSKITKFVKSNKFTEIIELVLQDDLQNPTFQGDWKCGSLKDARLFTEMKTVFKKIESIYKNEFKSLLNKDENIELSEIRKSFVELQALIPDVTIPSHV